MKKYIPRFNEADLQYLDPTKPDEARKIAVCRSFLEQKTLAAAARTAKTAPHSAVRILYSAIYTMCSRKYAALAKETSVLCVRIEHLIDDLPTKVRNGLTNRGYALVIDICLAKRQKILYVRDIGKKNIALVEQFLRRNDLAFGMTFDAEFIREIKKAAIARLAAEIRIPRPHR